MRFAFMPLFVTFYSITHFYWASGAAAQDTDAPISKEKCATIVRTHGFLSRAQFQCGFSYYSDEMLNAAKACTQMLSSDEMTASLRAGMQTFDRNETERGHDDLCQDIRKSFPKVFGSSERLNLDEQERRVRQFIAEGKTQEAVEAAQKLVSDAEKSVGRSHPAYANALKGLALAQMEAGFYEDALQSQKLGLSVEEQLWGQASTEVARSLNNLAEISARAGRLSDAKALFERALEIHRSNQGPEAVEVAETQMGLSNVLVALGQFQVAEQGYERALRIFQASALSGDRRVALTLVAMSNALEKQGKSEQAGELISRALILFKKGVGPNHPEYGYALVAMGNNILNKASQNSPFSQDRYVDAAPYLREALTVFERSLGANHNLTAATLDKLARATFFNTLNQMSNGPIDAVKSGIREFLELRRRTTRAVVAYEQFATKRFSADETHFESIASQTVFERHLAALRTAKSFELEETGALDRESIEVIQLAIRSRAADAMQLMAARFAVPDPTLSGLVRERQDQLRMWGILDRRLTKALAEGDEKSIREIRTNLSEIEQKIGDTSEALHKKFEDYDSLIKVQTLSVEETQRLLKPDQALLILGGALPFTDSWVVTKQSFRWHSTAGNLNTSKGWTELRDRIFALRCGLDKSHWNAGQDGRERCRKLLNTEVSQRQLPPYDANLAYELYRDLFGGIEDLIRGKSLLIGIGGADPTSV
jgi:tetratricopeptide (TPR) repeat protein